MSKMPRLIGPELQCLSSLTTFSRRFRILGPTLLSLGEISAEHRALTTLISLGDFSDTWDMQDLLQSNQHLDLTYYQSTPLSQNNYGPRKSNLHPFLLKKKHFIFSLIFLDAEVNFEMFKNL